jgi:hypothetical protein
MDLTPRRRRGVAIVAVLAALAAAIVTLLVSVSPADATLPGVQGPIFVELPGGAGIQRMNPDGSGKTVVVRSGIQLPIAPGENGPSTMKWPSHPAVSSDGTLIAFDAVVQPSLADFPDNANRELFTFNVRDGAITRLRPLQRATSPEFAPGSTATAGKLAYITVYPTLASAVATSTYSVVRPVLSAQSVWTPSDPGDQNVVRHFVGDLDWSPDGRVIAYNDSVVERRTDGNDANGEPWFKLVWVTTVRLVEPRIGGIRTALTSAERDTQDLAAQPVSWAPDGRRLLVATPGLGLQILGITTSYGWSGSADVFGTTASDREAVFAPSNTTGTPGDTILTRRGDKLYLLTSSATEGKIKGPIGNGFHPVWLAYPFPQVLGVAVPLVPALPPVALPPELQPRDLLIKSVQQTCAALPAACLTPTVPNVATTTTTGPSKTVESAGQ